MDCACANMCVGVAVKNYSLIKILWASHSLLQLWDKGTCRILCIPLTATCKQNAKWGVGKKKKKKKEMVLREETKTNKCSATLLFHNIWSHILWWHRWVAGAPARRGGRCAAALSLWWPRWPGTELFREEHVNKCRANPLSMHRHKASHKWATPAPPPTLAGPLYMMNIHMDASKCLHLMIKISITPPTAEGGIIPARRKPRFVAREWQFSSITPNISSGTSRHLLSLMTELFRKPLRGRGVYL